MKYKPQSIKKLLKETKLSQSEFGRKVGASRQKVYNWLTLGDQPEATMLMEIAARFNKPMSYFFDGSNSDSSK